MGKELDLTPYQIGNVDAWSQIESNRFLNEAFLPVTQFTQITNAENLFLCGRRGSGKSAIAIKLAEQTKWHYKDAVQGEATQYGLYIDVVKRLSNECAIYDYVDVKRSVQRLWDWILPLKAMQTVLAQAAERSEPMDIDLMEIERYLESLPAPLNPTSTIGEVLTNTFDNALVELPNGKLDTYLTNLKGTREYKSAVNALERITESRNMLIVLDTIESYKIFSPFMIEGFRGIVEAIHNFSIDKRMRNISLKFFIPAEIFEKAFTGMPSKVGSGTVFMHWRSADLIAMLAGRYLSVLEKNKTISEERYRVLREVVDNAYAHEDGRILREEFWYKNNFLPRTIHHDHDIEEDCWAYMLRHTFRRPRDVAIIQMQEIINNALMAGEFPCISEESIKAGVHKEGVLTRILGDALSPFEGPIPGDVINSARSVFYGRSQIMLGQDLRRFAKDLYSLYPFPDIDVDEFTPMLLRAGVIGMTLDLPSKLYHQARFEYLMTANLPFRYDIEYCVHPVMGNLFHMQRPKDGRLVYPLAEHDPWLEKIAGI